MRSRSILFTLMLLVGTLFIPARDGSCTGIVVSNPSVGTLSGGSTTVTFNVTWNKSWRNAAVIGNWDAAWVFVKFRKNGGDWMHASLNDTGHSMPSGATSSNGLEDTSAEFNIASNPVVGVFVYRSSDGAGTFTANNVGLSWNYAQDGVADSDNVEIQIIGIEMVFIPDGSFFAGDTTASNSFKQGSADSDPWWVSGEGAITTGTQTGTGTGSAETAAEYYDPLDTSGYTLPAAFPKGYRRFYMMKGEISQGQWVAFFNTLTATQMGARDKTAPSYKNSDGVVQRNNVSWSGSGGATLPDRSPPNEVNYAGVAMGFLEEADQAAYLDWAGLRPMSELEFERACRGPYRAVAGEYAWGAASSTQATSISNSGRSTEAAQFAANVVYGDDPNVQGPMRVGAMSYNKTNRIASGAGYYGNMDLSGNLFEVTVTTRDSSARDFNGSIHGDGALTSGGNADVSSWPTGPDSYLKRGGSWGLGSSEMKVSLRNTTPYQKALPRDYYGGRGVRSAP